MSRTYRFKKQKGYVPWFNDYDWKLWELVPENSDLTKYVEFKEVVYKWTRNPVRLIMGKLNPKSKEGLKIISMSHRDSTFRFKEPGPHWFRNLYTDRPLRRKYKEELRRFKLDSDYEINYINSKLVYWT